MQPFGDTFFLDGNAMGKDGRFGLRQIVCEETDMPLAPGACVRVDPDMHLQRAYLEPGATPRAQFLGLGEFGKSEDFAIEFQAVGLQRFGNGDLDVVDTDDPQRHARFPLLNRSLASMVRGW